MVATTVTWRRSPWQAFVPFVRNTVRPVLRWWSGITHRHTLSIHRSRRGQLKCDGTRAETRFHLSAKRTSPFKSAGASVQSTTGSRGVRISGSNARYTVFRGSVKSTGYSLHSPVSPSLPLPYVTVCHHISAGLYTRPDGMTDMKKLICAFCD